MQSQLHSALPPSPFSQCETTTPHRCSKDTPRFGDRYMPLAARLQLCSLSGQKGAKDSRRKEGMVQLLASPFSPVWCPSAEQIVQTVQ